MSTTPDNPEGKEEVLDLNRFITLLTNWHAKRVAKLEEILNIPEGTEVTMNEGDPMPLVGDTLKGFRLGVALSLSQLGQLPFEAEYEPSTDGPIQ